MLCCCDGVIFVAKLCCVGIAASAELRASFQGRHGEDRGSASLAGSLPYIRWLLPLSFLVQFQASFAEREGLVRSGVVLWSAAFISVVACGIGILFGEDWQPTFYLRGAFGWDAMNRCFVYVWVLLVQFKALFLFYFATCASFILDEFCLGSVSLLPLFLYAVCSFFLVRLLRCSVLVLVLKMIFRSTVDVKWCSCSKPIIWRCRFGNSRKEFEGLESSRCYYRFVSWGWKKTG